jgi:hypothetical protein
MNACPACGWTHVAGDVTAVSRFSGVIGYGTAGSFIVHPTREAAQAWLCEERQARTP